MLFRSGAGSLSVDVTILQGDATFEGNTYQQVNQYWIKDHWKDEYDAKVLTQINEIMHNAPGRAGGKAFYDNSDAMTDYFDTAFYTHLSIGAWNKNYALIK